VAGVEAGRGPRDVLRLANQTFRGA